MTTHKTSDLKSTVLQKYQDATELSLKSICAWNELLAASTDMAFDVVLKNWNYSRSLRSSAEQAVEDAIKTQHQLHNEMMQVWDGYTTKLGTIIKKTTD